MAQFEVVPGLHLFTAELFFLFPLTGCYEYFQWFGSSACIVNAHRYSVGGVSVFNALIFFLLFVFPASTDDQPMIGSEQDNQLLEAAKNGDMETIKVGAACSPCIALHLWQVLSSCFSIHSY